LLDLARQGPALLTAKMSDPSGYGRVVRDQTGQFVSVVEHKDATAEQLALTEINTGVLAIPTSLLNTYLPKVGNQNSQGEYYLPDVLPLAIADGHVVNTVCASDPIETEGVNTREQLARLERIYQHRQVLALMAAGVSFADPQRVDIRGTVRAGKDCFVDINAVFEGEVTLGDGVVIEPNCVIRSSTIGPFTRVCAMSHIEQAQVGAHASVGPFARLRPGTRLADKTKIGNFVETKNAVLGVGSKVNHLSYVGDAQIGIDVNIGAGTITCNYDGANKHTTELGDHVFIGSNSTLVAPLSIESNGFVGAGSVVTKPVKQGDLAVARSQQRNISGWKRPKKKD
jgi:bifunctional UDP-N-acetylglucosamine pyrophosphorylase/glucosamine-1-phosphate N-acetyltransferase